MSRNISRKIEESIQDFFRQNELDLKMSKSKDYDFSFVDSKKGEIACYIQSNIDQNEFSINIDSFNRLRRLLDSNTFNSVYLINNFGWYDLGMLLNDNDYSYNPKSVGLTLIEDARIDKIQSSNAINISLEDLYSVLTTEYDKEYIKQFLRKYMRIGTYLSNDNPHFIRKQIASCSLALVKILIEEDYKSSLNFIKTFDFVPDNFEWEGSTPKVPQTHPEISKLTIERFSHDIIENINIDRIDKLVSDNYNPSSQSTFLEFFVTTLKEKLIELLNLILQRSENDSFKILGIFWDTIDFKDHIENTGDGENFFGRFLSQLLFNGSYINKVLKRISFIDLADSIKDYSYLTLEDKEVTHVIKEEYHRFLHPKPEYNSEFIVTDSDGSGYDQTLGLNKMVPKNLLIYENNYDLESSYSYVRTLKLEFPDYSGKIFVKCSEITMGAFYLSGLAVKLLGKDDLQSHLPNIDFCFCFTYSKLDKTFTNFLESDKKPENIVLKIPGRAVEDRDSLLARKHTSLFDQLLTYIKYNRVREILQYKRYGLVHFLLKDANENTEILLNYRSPINVQQIKNKVFEGMLRTDYSSGPFGYQEQYNQLGAWKFSDYHKQENLSPYLFKKIDNDDARIKKLGFIPKRFMKIKGVDHWSDQYCFLEDWIKEIDYIEIRHDILLKKHFSKYDNSNFSYLDITANELAEHIQLDKENLEIPSDWIGDEAVSFNVLSFLRSELNPTLNINEEDKYNIDAKKISSLRRTYKLYRPGSYVVLNKNTIKHNKKWNFSEVSFDKPFLSSNKFDLLFEYVRDEYDDRNLTTKYELTDFVLELNMKHILDQIHCFAISPYVVFFKELKLLRIIKPGNLEDTLLVDVDNDKLLEKLEVVAGHSIDQSREVIEDYTNSEDFKELVDMEVNQRIKKFFTGRFHHQKSTIQHPLEFMITQLDIENIEELKKFISSKRGQNMLKNNIALANKAYFFTESLYTFYSKPVIPIDCSVNKLASDIQDSLKEYQIENSERLSKVEIVFDDDWPIYDEEAENIELELVPHIKIDNEFIDYTFLELIKNSLKYAFNDDNQKKIINIAIASDFQNNFIFIYSDNGVGFQESDKDRIFEFGQSMKNLNNKKNNGSGYGLHTMKNYLNDLGADINFEFPSKFIITLPICTIEE